MTTQPMGEAMTEQNNGGPLQIFQIGTITVMDDGVETEVIGVLLTGGVNAVRDVGKLMFQDVEIIAAREASHDL